MRQLCTNKLSFCHLFHRFLVTMEPHCSSKASKKLLKNINCHHHNVNDRFGLKEEKKSCFFYKQGYGVTNICNAIFCFEMLQI